MVLLVLGGAALGAAGMYIFARSDTDRNIVRREGGYVLVNPLLSCDISEDARAPELADVRERLQKVASKLIHDSKAERISVYVRDMDNGRWTGVEEDGLYAPASLMKVPLLVAYLKEAEKNPALLEKYITLPAYDDNARETYQSSAALVGGQAYRVDELLIAAIRDSDNNAADALTENIEQASLADVYENFGSPSVPESELLTDLMSPKVYMRFFRILYNASYLSKELSQQALALLTETNFKDGLVQGVPEGVVVAHKFGERTVAHKDFITGEVTIKKRELHDCGIVYFPFHPYGLCIMTEGGDFHALAEAIAAVSKEVYIAAGAGDFAQ